MTDCMVWTELPRGLIDVHYDPGFIEQISSWLQENRISERAWFGNWNQLKQNRDLFQQMSQ